MPFITKMAFYFYRLVHVCSDLTINYSKWTASTVTYHNNYTAASQRDLHNMDTIKLSRIIHKMLKCYMYVLNKPFQVEGLESYKRLSFGGINPLNIVHCISNNNSNRTFKHSNRAVKSLRTETLI